MKNKPTESRPCADEQGEQGKAEQDALERFLETQSKKCAVHHRTHTSEVMALIRKHRKT